MKYRKGDDWGGGVVAIVAQNHRQMKFAAEYYALKNNVKDTNLRQAAIDVCAQPPVVINYLKLG